jgi:hypothetical protein
MTRTKADNGDSLATESRSIDDARAFRVGAGTLVHSPKSFPSSAVVVGKCGVVGNTAGDNDSPRPAYWADSLITCTTCKEA